MLSLVKLTVDGTDQLNERPAFFFCTRNTEFYCLQLVTTNAFIRPLGQGASKDWCLSKEEFEQKLFLCVVTDNNLEDKHSYIGKLFCVDPTNGMIVYSSFLHVPKVTCDKLLWVYFWVGPISIFSQTNTQYYCSVTYLGFLMIN